MPLTPEQVSFLEQLQVPIDASELFETTSRQKNTLIENALATLPDETTLRDTLDFSVFDKSGEKQIKAITSDPLDALETEEASDTQGLTKDQHLAINKLLQTHVFPAVDKLLAVKGADGESPLFTFDEIAQEVFEPLKRKGIFPETLIPDKYSIVQKYINAALQRYKQTLADQREARIKGEAKIDLDSRGMGTGVDRIKGLVGQGTRAADKLTDVATNNFLLRGAAGGETGTKEERGRGLKLAVSAGMLVKDLASAGSTVDSFATGTTLSSAERSVTNSKFSDDADKASYTFTFGKMLSKVLPVGEVANAALALESTYQGVNALASAVPGTIAAALQGTAVSGFGDKIDQAAAMAKWEEAAVKAVAGIPPAIDDALSNALGASIPMIGAMASGAYVEAVDFGTLDDAVRQDPPDGEAVIKELAAAFAKALDAVNPGGDAAPAFRKVGTAMSKAFLAKAKPSDFTLALTFDKDGERKPAEAAGPVAAAGKAAVSQASGLDKSAPPEDGDSADAFKKALADPQAALAIQKAAEAREQDELVDEMDRADKESRDFEDRLTLIDDAGELLAEQNTIERLIADVERDRKIIELAAGSLGMLSDVSAAGGSIAGSAVSTVAGGVTTATDMLANELLPALKLAKLIIKFSVNIAQAVQRINLLRKFSVQVQRAMTAGSPLSTTIRGFYANKQEQVAHHTVQDALIAVQIAGTIMQLTHYPPVMAAGKLVSVVGSAAESAEQFSYDVANEAALRKGWKVTKAAFKNPKNRRVGLQALQLNTTLAMHAVAWAAKEMHDGTAIQFLQACGLNERTLAINGSTEAKIRDYLMTLLAEDRVFLDPDKVATNWQPPTLEASLPGWIKLLGRARTKAEPKLSAASPATIEAAFKAVDKDKIALKALVDATPADRLILITAATPDLPAVKAARARAAALGKALDAYAPKTEANAPHDEMDVVVGQVKALADDWLDALDVVLVQSGVPIPTEDGEDASGPPPKPKPVLPPRKAKAKGEGGGESVGEDVPQTRQKRSGAVSS